MGFGFGLKKKWNKIDSVIQYSKFVLGNNISDEAQMLLLCHALEKGMGIPNVRKGYGKEKAKTLIAMLKEAQNKGNTEQFYFQESLSILAAYFEYQQSNNVDVSDLLISAQPLLKDFKYEYKGGFETFSSIEFKSGMSFDFESFTKSRHSMRSYSSDAVTKEEITRAISIAKRAPSACNRQPWKFYTSLSKQEADKIRNCVPKQNFLDGVPYFGIVTVKHNMFAEHESYQWFVNGGIFTGFLVLAFHQVGLGSCIFQYPVMYEKGRELRTILSIPSNETIVAAIGFGHYPEQAKCICADRKRNEEIIIFK